MTKNCSSYDGTPSIVEQPIALEETDGNAITNLAYESSGFGSTIISGIAFLGSVVVLLTILFSPEIALGVALSFAQKH
jgi:hypothetical protein